MWTQSVDIEERKVPQFLNGKHPASPVALQFVESALPCIKNNNDNNNNNIAQFGREVGEKVLFSNGHESHDTVLTLLHRTARQTWRISFS